MSLHRWNEASHFTTKGTKSTKGLKDEPFDPILTLHDIEVDQKFGLNSANCSHVDSRTPGPLSVHLNGALKHVV